MGMIALMVLSLSQGSSLRYRMQVSKVAPPHISTAYNPHLSSASHSGMRSSVATLVASLVCWPSLGVRSVILTLLLPTGAFISAPMSLESLSRVSSKVSRLGIRDPLRPVIERYRARQNRHVILFIALLLILKELRVVIHIPVVEPAGQEIFVIHDL